MRGGGWPGSFVLILALGCAPEAREISRSHARALTPDATEGAEGVPIGPSRVAAPLPEAGPRVTSLVPVREDAGKGGAVEASVELGARACPARVPGAVIEVTDVNGGAAILVTGTLPQVADLQERTRRMARAQRETAADPLAASGADALVRMPPARIEVVELARGARADYVAHAPADVRDVRRAVRRIAQRMRLGECPP